jgi:hypothetical protein
MAGTGVGSRLPIKPDAKQNQSSLADLDSAFAGDPFEPSKSMTKS